MIKWIKRFFSKPAFPPFPNIEDKMYGITETITDSEHIIGLDSVKFSEGLKKDKKVQAWSKVIDSVYIPFWFRLWCKFRHKGIYPEMPGPIQLAYNKIPTVVRKPTVINLHGEFAAEEFMDMQHKKCEDAGTIIIDGGDETVIGGGNDKNDPTM